MNENVRVLVFDLDGTLVDLYGVPNWLEMLRAEDTTPYEVAAPLYDMNVLCEALNELRANGIMVAVTTWSSMGGSREYNKRVRAAKIAWLEKYDFPFDIFHCQAYGTTKANATRKYGGNQILFDDNAKVRKGWTLGRTVDANFDIMGELYNLLCE
jgi:hypothetical protein